MIRAAFLIALAPASAGAFELALPVDCALGDTCYIQQYMDHDPSPASTDFTCGPLSYDGHSGTDIALENRAQMQAGVTVLASAPGTVKARRDGVADFVPFIPGQECGNGVVIDHGGGWETQYCHLQQGSILVRVGDAVDTGTPLGMIGQSGQADFPHVHLSVRRNGADIDPFAPEVAERCGDKTGPGLWTLPIPYVPGGIIGLGLATAVPDYDAIKAGLPSPNLAKTAPALVVWAYLYGGQAGDAVLLDLTGPQGVVISDRVLLEKTQAQLFRAVGKKLKTAAWPLGSYTGTAKLMRAGVEISTQAIVISVEN